jgi:hypothetical protein
MWRQRLQAKAIRDRMIRELRARPPEPVKKPEQAPETGPVEEKLPAET